MVEEVDMCLCLFDLKIEFKLFTFDFNIYIGNRPRYIKVREVSLIKKAWNKVCVTPLSNLLSVWSFPCVGASVDQEQGVRGVAEQAERPN